MLIYFLDGLTHWSSVFSNLQILFDYLTGISDDSLWAFSDSSSEHILLVKGQIMICEWIIS